MPRKKKVETKEKVISRSKTQSVFANLNTISRSYTSLIYGVITVVVLFALLFATVRIFTQHKAPTISEEGIDTAIEKQADNQYTVQQGDTLWSIAVSKYSNGYAWTEIAKANNLSNPGSIETGMKLVLPEKSVVDRLFAQNSQVTTIPSVVTPTATPTIAKTQNTETNGQIVQSGKIAGGEYTIQHGDTLWDISVRAYGTGYDWPKIAQANNLSNPGLIHSGNKLTLPRKG